MAGIAGKRLINSSENEQVFITGFYNAIMSTTDASSLNRLGANITCNTTPEAQFTEGVTIPTFIFTVRKTTSATDNLVFIFERSNTITNDTDSYKLTIKINNEVKVNQKTISFADTAKASSETSERQWFLGYYISVGYIYLYFGNYGVTAISSSDASLSSILDGNNLRYCGAIDSNNIESATYYKLGVPSVPYTIPNLFSYDSEPGYIEYITHKSFVNSNQEQSRTDSNVVSCSTVSQGRALNIELGNMFAVDAHTLLTIN